MRKNNKDYIIITLAGFLLKIKIVRRSYFGGRQDVILVCAKAHIIHPIIMTLKKKPSLIVMATWRSQKITENNIIISTNN